MLSLAVLTALPIAAAFIVCIGAFMAMVALMIRTQRRSEGRESPLATEFWRYRDNLSTSDGHTDWRSRKTRTRWTRPTIHFVTYRRGDGSSYVLPNEYEPVGATR